MKNRVIIFVVCVVLIVVGMVAALVGCSNDAIRSKDDVSHRIFIDEDTGVEYIVYKKDYGLGITPRYNADGTLKVYKEEQE